MKKIAILSFMICVAVFAAACKQQVKQEPVVQNTDTQYVQTSNEQLSKYPLSGFGYKSSKIEKQEWEKWAATAAPVIKGILEKLPEGYAIEVRGHTDGRGPEQPQGNKPGNLQISENRAKTVYDSLVGAGITSPKLKYRGVGSSELLAGVDPKDPKHRRVTFVVVKNQ